MEQWPNREVIERRTQAAHDAMAAAEQAACDAVTAAVAAREATRGTSQYPVWCARVEAMGRAELEARWAQRQNVR